MLRYILRHSLNLATVLLGIFRSQARQERVLIEFAEALQAAIVLGQRGLDGVAITRADVASVRKEFNEALDALEPLLPP